MKKLLVRVLVVLVVIVIAGVVAVGLFLDTAIKKGIETYGPQFTKVDVKLDSVSLSLFSGSGKVKGLIVGNPEGYKAPQAIRVGLASVSVIPGSVLSDKVVIKSIRVEGPEITFEGSPLQNNLNKIRENVNAGAGGGDKTPAKESTPKTTAPAEKKAGRKLQVDDFWITGAKVHLSTTLTVPLPDIHLTDLGRGPEGITPADLTKRVLNEVVSGALKAVGSAAADLGKGAANTAKEAGKTATESVGKAARGVTDLFKKKE